MKISKFLIIALTAGGFTACSSDDDIDMINNDQAQTLPLTITVTENPLINPDAPSQAPVTRADITTSSSLESFILDYQYYLEEELSHGFNNVKKVDGKWEAGNWPSTDKNNQVNWYAHSHGSFNEGEAPYINFTMEGSAFDQKDLLVAKASGTYSSTSGNISLNFDHACTALRFYVKKANNLSEFKLQVTNITLCNVINQGKYYYSNSSWISGDSRSSYTLYQGSAMELGSTEYIALGVSDAPYLFMIPQTLTPWDTQTDISSATGQTYIEITCIITNNQSFNYSSKAYIPFAATLATGYQHDVKINIGKNSLYSGPNAKIFN